MPILGTVGPLLSRSTSGGQGNGLVFISFKTRRKMNVILTNA